MAGWPAIALGTGAVAILAADFVRVLHDLRSRLHSSKPSRAWHRALAVVVFAGAAVLLMLAPGMEAVTASQVGLPAIGLSLAILCARATNNGQSAFWNDRALHTAFFAVFAGLGFLEEALVGFSLTATLQLLLQQGD